MELTGLSFIGFQRSEKTGTTFRGINPATGEQLGPDFHTATLADVDRAATLAAEAFFSFRALSGKRRSEFLDLIASRLEAHADELIARAALETGLPTAPRLQGEVARTCWQLRLYGQAAAEGSWVDARIEHGDPQRTPLPKPDLRSMMQPLGPVAVFGASNFPFAYSVAGGDTASALATGCPVVVKAHPAHPGTSELVAAIVQSCVREFGLHEGVFSMVFDGGYDIGVALVKHPAIKAVGFTGSRRGGRALMDIAAARPEPIPVYAEMGSVNPIFILPGAMRARTLDIAAGLHNSVTQGVGQFCTNPGLIVTEQGTATGEFLTELGNRIAATPVGTMLTPGICSAFRSGTEKFARTEGVQRIAAVDAGDGIAAAGATVFTATGDTFLANHDLMEEVFGPSTVVVQCADREQLLAAARAIEGQLTATVHGTEEDLVAYRDLIAILETKAGRLVFNGFPTGVEVCHAIVHGGPYPATSDGRSTSVGTMALYRFGRPIAYQNFPDSALPDELKEANPLGLLRMVDGERVRG